MARSGDEDANAALLALADAARLSSTDRTTVEELVRLDPRLAGLFIRGHELAAQSHVPGTIFVLAHIGRELSNGVVQALSDGVFDFSKSDGGALPHNETNRNTIATLLQLPPSDTLVTKWFRLQNTFVASAHWKSGRRSAEAIAAAFRELSELLHGRVVGKTTTAVCLAGALVQRGKRVLLVDLDPQASASVWLGVPTDGTALLEALLAEDPDLVPLVHQLPEGIDIIASGLGLTRFEASVAQRPGRDRLIRKALSRLPERWNYVLVDTPGSFNLLTVSALAAADYYLLPIEAALLSAEPLLSMLEGIRQVVEMLNPELKCAGVVACRVKQRANNPREILDLLREHVGDVLCETIIRDNINVAEAPAHRMSVGRYMGRSRGADDYSALAEEIERRLAERPTRSRGERDQERKTANA